MDIKYPKTNKPATSVIDPEILWKAGNNSSRDGFKVAEIKMDIRNATEAMSVLLVVTSSLNAITVPELEFTPI